MTFFNRKEEVIEVELTPYGRYLLSLGEWDPVYYAFFDDDIIYDSDYSGFSENQNDAESRIKESLRNHTQAVYRDLNDEYDGAIEYDDRRIQNTFEREYSLSSRLGIVDFYSTKAPAWDIDCLKGEITSSAPTYSGSGPNLTIPQINMKNPRYNKIVGTLSPTQGPDIFDEDLRDVYEFTTDFVEIRRDYILLQIGEENIVPQRENFDIEIFRVVEETDKAGNVTDRLEPLKFKGPRHKNNTQFVDYYFDLDMDSAIDPEIMCKYKPQDGTTGLFDKPEFQCGDDTGNVETDQYRARITDIGEVCD
tara:strand:+ start:61 stop:978 length:918 start_codon:yes stop_codon:yes gene_type:complete